MFRLTSLQTRPFRVIMSFLNVLS